MKSCLIKIYKNVISTALHELKVNGKVLHGETNEGEIKDRMIIFVFYLIRKRGNKVSNIHFYIKKKILKKAIQTDII